MLKISRFIVVILTFIQIIPAQETKAQTNVEIKSTDFKKPLKLCGIYENFQIKENSLASDNDNIFLSLINGEIVSIDKNSKDIKWKTNLGGKPVRTPVIFNQNLIVLSTSGLDTETNLSIRLINKENGLVIWQNSLKELKNEMKGEIEKNKISLTDSFTEDTDSINIFPYNDRITLVRKNYLVSLNLFDGKIVAEKQIQEKISTEYLIDEENIIFGTAQKEIFVLSAKDFSSVRKIKVSSEPAIVHMFQNDLIWGDDKGNLFKTSGDSPVQKNKKLFRTGGKITDMLIFRQNYLITSLDNFTYYISRQKGDILWKRRLAGRPEYKPLIIGDTVFIQSVGENSVWIVDLNSGNIINKISLENDNFLVGEVLGSFPYILLQSKKGIFFYTYNESCR